jgi:hypothetical protein
VAVKENDHVAFWKLNFARSRCGRVLQQPQREFRFVANLHLPERVVAVIERPQREISGRGCFAFATTRSGRFFSLVERFRTLGVTYIYIYFCIYIFFSK